MTIAPARAVIPEALPAPAAPAQAGAAAPELQFGILIWTVGVRATSVALPLTSRSVTQSPVVRR